MDKELPKYKIDLMYLGTAYVGWQTQCCGNAVQDKLKAALTTALREETRVIGASRTDSGVHALHQVAVFSTAQTVDCKILRRSLNGLMPADIAVRKISPVAADFHPVTSAKGKAYRYRLWTARSRNPFMTDFSWHTLPDTDISYISKHLPELSGTHDFSSFCAVDSSAKTRERTLFEVGCRQRGPLFDMWFIGNGFLKQMVRSMAGTLVDLSRNSIPGDLPSILAAKDRTKAGQTAPAPGLILVEIFYDDIPAIEDLIKRCDQKKGFAGI